MHMCANKKDAAKNVSNSKPKHDLHLFLNSDTFGMLLGTLWSGFSTNIDCSLENATSQTPWFNGGISTVLTAAAGPGSIQWEENAHAEKKPVLGIRKNRSANDF